MGGACISMPLRLPMEWTDDRARCDRVGVPRLVPSAGRVGPYEPTVTCTGQNVEL